MKLTIDSICLISSIIDKMEIDSKFINEMISLGKTGKGKTKEFKEELQKQIGMKIVLKIGSKIYLTKDELIEFVANYKDITKEEAKKIDITDIIKDLIKDKDFVSFFKSEVMSK